MTDNKINILSRLVQIRAELHLSSKDFAAKAGIDASNYSSIEKGKRSFGDRVMRDICTAFDINRDWLLTGEGEMLKNSLTKEEAYTITHGKGVPYYDVDFIGGFDLIENDQTINPTYMINFPQYSKADSWVNISGHSMEPQIGHGDIIALKEIHHWEDYVLYGEIYAIVTDQYRTVKRISKSSEGREYVKLVPINKEYDEQDIKKEIIKKVYQVIGCAKKIF